VSAHLDFLQRKATRVCKVIGEGGTLIWDLIQNKVVFNGPSGSEEVLFEDQHFDRNAMYMNELAHFARVAAGKIKPLVDLHQGLEVLRLLEMLKLSSDQQRVVSIEEVSL